MSQPKENRDSENRGGCQPATRRVSDEELTSVCAAADERFLRSPMCLWVGDRAYLDLRDERAATASARARIAELEAELANLARECDRQIKLFFEASAELAEAKKAIGLLRNGKDRRMAGLREAVTMLHSRAATMNDPNARAVLNSAALDIGTHVSRLNPSSTGETA